MAKEITCPNCGFSQNKYTTNIEDKLITCLKCNYRWVNIGETKIKESSIKVVMNSVNHYNYTMKNLNKKKEVFPFYALNNQYVKTKTKTKTAKNRALVSIPKTKYFNQYDVAGSYDYAKSGYQGEIKQDYAKSGYQGEIKQDYAKAGYQGEIKQDYAKSGYQGEIKQDYTKTGYQGEIKQDYTKTGYQGEIKQDYTKTGYQGEIKQDYTKTGYQGEIKQDYTKTGYQGEIKQDYAKSGYQGEIKQDYTKTGYQGEIKQDYAKTGYQGEIKQDYAKTGYQGEIKQDYAKTGYQGEIKQDYTKTGYQGEIKQDYAKSNYKAEVKTAKSFPDKQLTSSNKETIIAPIQVLQSEKIQEKNQDDNRVEELIAANLNQAKSEIKKDEKLQENNNNNLNSIKQKPSIIDNILASKPKEEIVKQEEIKKDSLNKQATKEDVKEYDDLEEFENKHTVIKSNKVINTETFGKNFEYKQDKLQALKESIKNEIEEFSNKDEVQEKEEEILEKFNFANMYNKFSEKLQDDLDGDKVEKKREKNNASADNKEEKFNIFDEILQKASNQINDEENEKINNQKVNNNTKKQGSVDIVGKTKEEGFKNQKNEIVEEEGLVENNQDKDFFETTQEANKSIKYSFKDVAQEIKDKFFTFNSKRGKLKLIAYIVALIVVIYFVNSPLFNRNKEENLIVENNAVKSIPTIDETPDLATIIPGKNSNFSGLILGNNIEDQSSKGDVKNVIQKDTNDEYQKEIVQMDQDKIFNNKDKNNSVGNKQNVELHNQTTIIGTVKGYFNDLYLSTKQLSFNFFSELKVVRVESSWKNTNIDRTFEILITIKNQDRSNLYILNSLEIIFLDKDGNSIESRMIEPNQIVENMESIVLKIRIPDVVLSTTNAYVFVNEFTPVLTN